MLITVNLDLYRYEIHSLVKAFYPEENVRAVVPGFSKKIPEETPFMEVAFERDRIRVRILPEGPEASAEGSGPAMNEKSRECKTLLKHLLYDFLDRKSVV